MDFTLYCKLNLPYLFQFFSLEKWKHTTQREMIIKIALLYFNGGFKGGTEFTNEDILLINEASNENSHFYYKHIAIFNIIFLSVILKFFYTNNWNINLITQAYKYLIIFKKQIKSMFKQEKRIINLIARRF